MISYSSDVSCSLPESEIVISNYTTHVPIEILNNTAFSTYGFEGNGTLQDPYIIEGYSIEVTGYMSNGIFISSTTSHFIIRNCLIIAEYLAIRIDQTAAGTATIQNNTCISSSGDGGGIGVGWLSGCSVINNTMINFMQGIHLNLAHSCLIQDNIVRDNNYQGINIRYSNNNLIKDNIVMNNTQHGIALVGSSSNNEIYSNTISDNAKVESYTIDGERTGTIQSQAYDEGPGNTWYDSVNEIGNEWSDYSGAGDYVIDGPSESVDIYPNSSTNISETSIDLAILALICSLFVVQQVLAKSNSHVKTKQNKL